MTITLRKDKSDKKEEVKADDKKAETKEEPTPTPTETTTPVAPENDVPTDTQTNTYSQPTPTPCVPTYTTVTHPEVGHYEQREVVPEHIRGIMKINLWVIRRVVFITAKLNVRVKVKVVPSKKFRLAQSMFLQSMTCMVVDQQEWTETVASGC